MVAGFDNRGKAALEVSDATWQQRSPGDIGVPWDAFEASFRFGGKLHRKIALGLTQNIDREIGAGAEMREKVVGVIDTDQDERRLQRDRRERIHG